MPVWLIVVIIVAVVVVLVLLAMMLIRRRRTERLRQQFGPEYGHTVAERGRVRRAESDLEARQQRRAALDIRPLSHDVQVRYANDWQDIQKQFVDRPHQAVQEANRLVIEVMSARGYPMADFEQRAADVSVDHPTVVKNYRAAHAIAEADLAGIATTEDMRQAMVHYRSLFEELLKGGAEPRRSTEVP